VTIAVVPELADDRSELNVTRHDDILVAAINRPPVNALNFSVRLEISRLIADAAIDPTIRGIVLTGAGAMFCAGADIAEFSHPPREPLTWQLAMHIEASSKPVLAALHGNVFGGGLELALACHYRVSSCEAWLALPEVKIGLIPGGGGTQRLPRLIGVERAAQAMLTGAALSAAEAYDAGMLDAVVENSQLVGEAIALARGCTGPRRTCDREAAGGRHALADYLADAKHDLSFAKVGRACSDAIEAGLGLAIAQGQRVERAFFEQVASGLRHVFFAERAAAKVPGRASPVRTALLAGLAASSRRTDVLVAGGRPRLRRSCRLSEWPDCVDRPMNRRVGRE
jgi:3-hydroxyacyl-CoA dehydrogenase